MDTKKTALVAPLYKGLVQNPDSAAVALMTKRDPTTHNTIEDATYIELMHSQRENTPELLQNVARATAAAVLAHKEHAHLISVEGCPQQVGDNTLVGSEIVEHIWRGVVPRDIINPEQFIIEDISGCTVEEVRTIMSHLSRIGIIDGVTHEYHKPRTEQIFQEEKAFLQHTVVRTPSSVANSLSKFFPRAEYIREVIRAGEPTQEFIEQEQKMERILGPLHTVSRMMEKGTFGLFNLEKTLAARMRK